MRHRCTCLVVGALRSIAVLAFVMNDLLLFCEPVEGRGGGGGARTPRGDDAGKPGALPPLRPWLLWPMREILLGDEATDGDRGTTLGHLSSAPISEHSLLLRPANGDEYVRVDFTTAEAMVGFRDAVEAERDALVSLDFDARRSERRLQLSLEPAVQKLVAALQREWCADEGWGRKSKGAGRLLKKRLSANEKAQADLVKSLQKLEHAESAAHESRTPPPINQALAKAEADMLGSPRSSRASAMRQSVRDVGQSVGSRVSVAASRLSRSSRSDHSSASSSGDRLSRAQSILKNAGTDAEIPE